MAGLSTYERWAILKPSNGIEIHTYKDIRSLLDHAIYMFLSSQPNGTADLEAFDAYMAEIREVIKHDQAEQAAAEADSESKEC